ncbi:MAG: DUF4093 domain-containing protein [Oscillospiraceae bacterium]|nr:DUF4093 domain-containing protein [Oscillospiraceae bacterium]
MIKIKQAVIVEGKYDRIKLLSILDTVIIATDGFAIFRDREKQRLIRRLADARGLLILTDSDSAGFKIRSFIGGAVPKDKLIHAYIPDVFGKEKRKAEPSKEGKLGVEGLPVSTIMDALSKAGVTCEEAPAENRRLITNIDLYEDGFSGRPQSRERRNLLLAHFELPERLSTGALVDVLNAFVSYEEYKSSAESIMRNYKGGHTDA